MMHRGEYPAGPAEEELHRVARIPAMYSVLRAFSWTDVRRNAYMEHFEVYEAWPVAELGNDWLADRASPNMCRGVPHSPSPGNQSHGRDPWVLRAHCILFLSQLGGPKYPEMTSAPVQPKLRSLKRLPHFPVIKLPDRGPAVQLHEGQPVENLYRLKAQTRSYA